MFQKIRTLYWFLYHKFRELILYCVVGGIVTVLSFALYLFFSRFFGFHELVNFVFLSFDKLVSSLIGDTGFHELISSLIEDTDFHKLVSSLSANIIVTFIAFFGNKYLVFQKKNGNRASQMVLFFVGSACQILIDLFIMYIMLHLFVVYDIIAKVVSEVFVISFGFIFRKFIVFKR